VILRLFILKQLFNWGLSELKSRSARAHRCSGSVGSQTRGFQTIPPFFVGCSSSGLRPGSRSLSEY
jgi:hypothetical protein